MANEGLREMAELLDRIVPKMREVQQITTQLATISAGAEPGAERAINGFASLVGVLATAGGSSGAGGGGSAHFGGVQAVGTTEGEARINQTLQQGFTQLIQTINTTGGGEGAAALFSIRSF